jgi:hypothetical protein
MSSWAAGRGMGKETPYLSLSPIFSVCMRILFLSYWGLEDPLTISTVFPHLQLLQQRPDVENVLLVTIERNGTKPIFQPSFPADKLTYEPLVSEPGLATGSWSTSRGTSLSSLEAK